MNQPQEPDQYGVVGHPVSHSWSPFIHGMFAKATAQNLVYRMFDIGPEAFRRDILKLFAGGVRGLNVTLPHKQAAAELVNELTPRAARAQAVNTIAFFEDTTLLGDNTDGVGLTCDLERNLKLELGDKRLLILAPAARCAACWDRCWSGNFARSPIANRTSHKAQTLVGEFADMAPLTGCGFSGLRGPRVRSHHQRDVRGPSGRNAGAAGRHRRSGDRVLRHVLWPGRHAVHAVGQVAARGPHCARAGACWWNRRRNHSCCGAVSAPTRNPSSRPWPSTS